MALSKAVEARIEVSVWLNETAVIVSVDVGQRRTWFGPDDGRERSYIEIELEDAATEEWFR